MSIDPLFQTLLKDFSLTTRQPRKALNFLEHHNCPNTAAHSEEVCNTALRLANRFDVDFYQASTAAWLHDISAVFPDTERLAAARQLGIPILPEEEQVPLLLHQKISALMAEQIFEIRGAPVLDAIACHTTLKAQPTQLDLVLFVADKLAWDQKGRPPYADELEAALEHSLEKAAWVYQDWLLHSGKIRIVHPWMRQSHTELQEKFAPQP